MKLKLKEIQFKQLVCLVSICLFCITLFSQHIKIESDYIKIEYDNNFNRDIQWLEESNNSLTYFESNIQEEIVINGIRCNSFKINGNVVIQRKIIHNDFGLGEETIITGTYQNDDLNIERKTKIFLPKDFSNVAIFQTSYKNLGKKIIRIDSVYSQHISLNQKTKEINTEEPFKLASFQGGINEWGKDYSVIWLTAGFEQDNFQGIHSTADDEVIGGGMPFVDIWGKDMGIAIMHLETKPQWLSLPVKVGKDNTVEFGILEIPNNNLGQDSWLEPNETYQTVLNSIIFHRLDYYDALSTYSNLLRKRGIDIPTSSPKGAYDPYWKSWGFELDFTLDEILGILPELDSMGIHIANLDDGWFDYYGDWSYNRSLGKFPNGKSDMISFVNEIHEKGFKTNLWWYPLGVSPESKLVKNHEDFLIMDQDGNFPLESRKLYQLCPAYKPAMDYIKKLVQRFTMEWGFDGLYSDTRGLSAVPPCYNPKHEHITPLESFESVPVVFEVINSTLKSHNKNAIHEVCICAVPHSPYNMPYYDIASASDPINLLQTRRRIKVEKAIHGPTYAVGDCYQVPDDEWSGFSVPQAFESAIGTGAQVTTFYTDLDPVQRKHWNRWFKDYSKLKLSSSEYVNLYDVAFDKPEVHVIKNKNDIFYGIYADLWSKKDTIELRGLQPGINYSVFDYSKNKKMNSIKGDTPYLNVGFRDFLLIRLEPED